MKCSSRPLPHTHRHLPTAVPTRPLHPQHLCLLLILPAVPPSPELVKRVRDLYHKRLPDVRFLIPVLNGLEKVGTGCPDAPTDKNMAGREPEEAGIWVLMLDALSTFWALSDQGSISTQPWPYL